MTTTSSDVATHCAYCGRLIATEADAPERFGERFCSASHAAEFVAGVRGARMAPLVWTGGWAATGGSLLTFLALLACPLGMYFMMRGMMNMHQRSGSTAEHPKDDRRA